METNERNPLKWSDAVWASVLRILAGYIYKWSGPDSPNALSPEARDEIRSRIVMDICTGEIPEGITPVHYVFRVARKWRVKGWAGDTETDRERKRKERSRARADMKDPGSAESEGARNKSPYRGVSDDARQPSPLAILVAIETATAEGLRYVSDRQRKARRRPVKGNAVPTFKARATGFAGKPRAGFGKNGRPLYYPGARTLITWETVAPTVERGEYDRKSKTYKPHVPYVGTVANRMIGKAKTAPTGSDPVGLAMATMAIFGRTGKRRFIRAPIPTTGIPATPGDGTEWRPIRE
ncbi:MAG: hypothetical protein EBT15_11320 [Betaproteobacteria bacterium]|nr:hypothetical protein [Betaproteobacteria bacterium]